MRKRSHDQDPNFRFSVDLLREYSTAALKNAIELLNEAALLYENGHVARAYFLAVASIEETGKALQAFDAQGRNLKDPSVTSTLRKKMEKHEQKITMAFIPRLSATPEDSQAIMRTINLMIHLTRGREPSMYTDIIYNSRSIQEPSAMVRQVAAKDCVRVADDCLVLAQEHISKSEPLKRSRAEDYMFSMKQEHLKQMHNNEGFWRYLITELKSGRRDFAVTVMDYHKKYLLKNKCFADSETFRTEAD